MGINGVFTVVVPAPPCKGEYVTCVYDLELQKDGTCMSCDNCHDYLEISNGTVTWKSCPCVEGWGFHEVMRKCEYHITCSSVIHYLISGMFIDQPFVSMRLSATFPII